MRIGPTDGPRRRVSPLLWIGLGISLALNVSFAAGLLSSDVFRQPEHGPIDRYRRAAAQLDLDASQRGAFQKFLHQTQENLRLLGDNNKPLFQAIWSELAKPNPDEAAVSRLMDQAAQNRRRYVEEMVSAVSQFSSTLSPEQRSKFVALARHHRK